MFSEENKLENYANPRYNCITMEIFSCYDNILMHNILIRIFSFTFVKLKIVCCHDGEQFIAKTRRFHWIVSALLSRNNFNNKTDNTMKKYKYRSIGIVPKSNKKTSRIRYP